MHILYLAVYYIAKVQMRTPTPLKPGAEKERFVTFKPAKEGFYKGPLSSNEDVKPVEIGGTWYPAPLSATSDKSNIKVIYHVHGGAFVMGDGRTQASGYFAKKLLKHTPATHVFCPQYRLSTLPASKTSNPFPAALQDSLTGYLYLLNDLKVPPKNIVFSGDSAGANAIMSLMKYIVEYGSDLPTPLPNPAAAFLWSPWIDPSNCSGSYVHDNANYVSDYISPPFTTWGSSAYAGLAGLPILTHPYISHKNRTFKTDIPIYVNVGGAEVLYADVAPWAELMQKAGNDVEIYVEKIVSHDALLVGNVTGFEKEATNSAKKAGEWVKSKL